MKQAFSRFVISLLVLTPFFSEALTQEQLQVQINALLQQVSALQAQLQQQNTSSSPIVEFSPQSGVSASQQSSNQITPNACPRISRVLSYGVSGDDVAQLQAFLAQDSSIYPEGVVSGFYGGLTEAAVQRWQTKFGIISYGTSESTGFGRVGPRTATQLASQCTNGTASQVGGFIKVTPITGAAPLLVSVEATLNTPRSCGSATYTLSWGDGSSPEQSPIAASVCDQVVRSFSHTYTTPGTYTITLSALGHSTTATVTVSGNAPVGTVSGTTNSDTFAVTTTTGAAPLSVTFSGTVNGSKACGGGFYTLLFGDTQTQTVTYPATCAPHQFSLSHQYANPGIYNAALFRGSVGSQQVGTVPITVTSPAATFQIPVLSIGVAQNPRTVSLRFDVPSVCAAYEINWGDSTERIVQSQGSCSSGSATQTFLHTYSGSGQVVVTLRRGAGLERVDTMSLTVN